MAIIIDGKKIARDIRKEVKSKAVDLKTSSGIVPGLTVILVGNNPASEIYVQGKISDCEEVDFFSRTERLPGDTDESKIAEIIQTLNYDDSIHGILVQLPLPNHINPNKMIEMIDPRKDVDGLHPYNVGRLFTGCPYHRSCTPAGCIELLDRTGIEITGKEVVIVGRSNLVGKPLAMMLLSRNATVTLCHTKTKNLPEVTRRADILIAAAGKAELINGAMVKEGAVVIDVGMNRLADRKLVGDVVYAEVAEKASYITPVPGGVGPMTRAMLLVNTLNAAMGIPEFMT
ncbi:MAG: bifunctional methylenetetrahydrofolate dehydrogenase/methenyltetrahydrofolate cyclohydrolase FolD [Deltaproteobacteria bacterium]|nr:bifunctional methylenetetrahydrofolate dehydrogenase/methenyltetrahydrofolate cyclohydrolase FolD [Deltaproteobacteria bacterium]